MTYQITNNGVYYINDLTSPWGRVFGRGMKYNTRKIEYLGIISYILSTELTKGLPNYAGYLSSDVTKQSQCEFEDYKRDYLKGDYLK